MSAHSLYTQTVIDHHRAPRNFGVLRDATHAADGANPLCGDSLRIEVRIVDERIAQVRFRGEACAIAIAAASMLSELAIGKSQAELRHLEFAFARRVSGEAPHDDALADLNTLAALADHSVRRKCALLPFATLRAAIGGIAKISTEEHNT